MGGTLHPNGDVVMVPGNNSYIGIYDPDDKTSNFYTLGSPVINKF